MMGTQQFGGVLAARVHSASTWTLSRLSGNVQVGANAADGPTIFWEEQVLDLSNFLVADETLFIGSVQPQHITGFSAQGSFSGAGNDAFYCNEIIIVTERHLDDPYTDLTAMAVSAPPVTSIGGASGTTNPSNVMFARFNNYGFSGALADAAGEIVGSVGPYLVLNVSNTWGSGSATANDKLYFYRMVVFGDTGDGSSGNLTMGMPELNIVWTAVSDKETELKYFQRLRQSWMDRAG